MSAQLAVVPTSALTREKEDAIVAHALRIIESRMRDPDQMQAFGVIADVKSYLQLHLGAEPAEIFAIAFLDAQHRLIEFRKMFFGSLTQTSVYPREVVRAALELHASAVILTHNHPSGTLNPSRADEALTKCLKDALALIDVRVIDHVVVSAREALSFAERGLL